MDIKYQMLKTKNYILLTYMVTLFVDNLMFLTRNMSKVKGQH